MTKQEVKGMTRQARESKDVRIWVEQFDEEDWKQLFIQDLWEPFETDRALMRVD